MATEPTLSMTIRTMLGMMIIVGRWVESMRIYMYDISCHDDNDNHVTSMMKIMAGR